jgi:hypothetical protein
LFVTLPEHDKCRLFLLKPGVRQKMSEMRDGILVSLKVEIAYTNPEFAVDRKIPNAVLRNNPPKGRI